MSMAHMARNHRVKQTLPVTSISSALSSSSPTSPLACNFSISYDVEIMVSVEQLYLCNGTDQHHIPNTQATYVGGEYCGQLTQNTRTYALPITPQTSFAIEPFSFSREKNPGLFDRKLTRIAWEPSVTHIPRNFLDFINDDAFIM